MSARRRVAALVFVLLVAGAGWWAARAARAEKPLRIARGGRLISVDPLLLESTTIFTVSNVFEGLVRRGRNMNLEPALAVRWTIPDDHTWVFDLRENVRFHDGAPLTAAEVKTAFDRVRDDEAAPGKQLLVSVATIEATGERTLRFTTRVPDPLLLQRLSLFRIARGATTREVEDHHAGTGPYRIDSWSHDGVVRLSAFEGYWGPAPASRRVEILPTPLEARFPALARGELDLAVLPNDVGATSTTVPVVRQVTLSRMFLWPCGASADPRGPLADARVRRALSLALDRPALGRELVGDPAAAASQLVPRTLFGYDQELQPAAFDPAAARRLLADAGWAKGFELPLFYLRDSPLSVSTAEAVSRALAPLAIRSVLRPLSSEDVLAAFRGESRGLLVSLWTFDDGDAGSFLRDCLRTRDAAAGLGVFNPGYSDPVLDAAVDGAMTVVNDSLRLDRYHAIMQRLEDEMPVVPLFDQVILVGVAPGLRWQPRPDALILAADVTRNP